MSFSAKTGLMYIPAQNIPAYFSAAEEVMYRVNRWNTGVDLNTNRDPKSWVAGRASMDALIYGELVAWDPIKKQRAWQVQHAKPSNGGILSTAGDLVFQGTWDGTFAAYDAYDGEKLWQYKSDSAVLAGPMTFELDGEQYVAVAQGSGGTVMITVGDELQRNKTNQNKLLVFKKGQFNQTNPVANEELTTILALGHAANTDPELIKLGESIYHNNCGSCHGINALSNYVVPNLRYMSEQTHNDFASIVIGGTRTHKGMIGFYETLGTGEVDAIHAYLDDKQQNLPDRLELTFLQKIEYWFNFWMAKLGAMFPELLNATRAFIM